MGVVEPEAALDEEAVAEPHTQRESVTSGVLDGEGLLGQYGRMKG